MSRLAISGGELKGRRIEVPAGANFRPTSARVREALMSSLYSVLGDLSGLRGLDLFAGSGALGIELLSRGVDMVTFVEKERVLASSIEANLAQLSLSKRAGVYLSDVQAALMKLAADESRAFDIVISDPPYRSGEHPGILKLLAENQLLAPKGVIVLEDSESLGAEFEGYSLLKEKRYGDTFLTYLMPAR